MELSIARRLSEGVGSYLHYSFCCNKAGLFNEDFLKFSVGDILSTVLTRIDGARVYSNYKHPALNQIKKKGASRRVDFALINRHVEKTDAKNVFIEAKWAGSSHCKLDTIIYDLYRLAFIKKQHPESNCIFLIAGQSKDLNTLLSAPPFRFPDGTKLLNTTTNEKRFKLSLDNKYHRDIMKKSVTYAHNKFGVSLPLGFTTVCTKVYPIQTEDETLRFQSVAWEIKSLDSHNLPIKWYI
ncbi:hypothetical protein QWJ20_00095 [Pectobacterium sp. S5]|uniref:hypothetical protein n=1 Tax=Pectobacterium TaxID=122277 RepID=UPI003D9AF11B